MGETGRTADRDGPRAAERSRSWIGWIAAYFVTLYLIWYLITAAYLAVFSSEGALPPTWRDPDVPAGAEVVSVRDVCGGNGPCWREVRIRPA